MVKRPTAESKGVKRLEGLPAVFVAGLPALGGFGS